MTNLKKLLTLTSLSTMLLVGCKSEAQENEKPEGVDEPQTEEVEDNKEDELSENEIITIDFISNNHKYGHVAEYDGLKPNLTTGPDVGTLEFVNENRDALEANLDTLFDELESVLNDELTTNPYSQFKGVEFESGVNHEFTKNFNSSDYKNAITIGALDKELEEEFDNILTESLEEPFEHDTSNRNGDNVFELVTVIKPVVFENDDYIIFLNLHEGLFEDLESDDMETYYQDDYEFKSEQAEKIAEYFKTEEVQNVFEEIL